MLKPIIHYIKKYFQQYAGLNNLSWYGIGLSFFESVFVGVFYFLPIYFVGTLKLSINQSGIIISCYGIGTILGGYIGGNLADIFNSRLVILVGLFIQAIVLFYFSHWQSFIELSSVMFVLGFGSYAFITANQLWVLDKCQNAKQSFQAINILNTASNLGMGIAAVILSLVVKNGFNRVFLCASLLIATLFFSFLFLTIKLQKEKKFSDGFSNSVNNSPIQPNVNLLLLALTCLFLVGFLIFQLSSNYSIYVAQYIPTIQSADVGKAFAFNAFLVVLLQTPIGNYFSNANKILVMGSGAFLLGLGLFLIIFCHNLLELLLACSIDTIGEILFFSVCQLICYEAGNKNKKGKAMGLYRSVYAASRVISPITGSYIFSKLGGDALWMFCGGIGLSCWLVCYVYYKKWHVSEVEVMELI